MKIVVTGVSGFLGRTVVRRLAGFDGTVVGVSRRALPGNIQVVDYSDTPPGDVLIHLAETADRAVAERAGWGYEEKALSSLRALLNRRYPRVVYASSAVLYGDRAETPRRPGDPIFEVDVYTRVKASAERSVLDSSGGLVARLGNLFGPWMDRDNVISTILGQIPGTGPVRVRDAHPVRDFLWVEDAADLMVRMATGAAIGVFNVGSGTAHSIGDVARVSLQVAGQDDRAVVSTEPGARSSYLVLDISGTVSMWDWAPATTLEEGIGRLLSWRRTHS